MPNHISNRITIDGDYDEIERGMEAIQALMKTDDSPFDFNVLFQYPEAWGQADKVHRAAMDRAFQDKSFAGFDSLPTDGYNHGGYEWCIQHWGTKWDAYEIGFGYDEITFNTAWSTPIPIFLELSKRLPDLRIQVEYADEDRGRNCGKMLFHAGIKIAHETEDDLRDPAFFARCIIAEQTANDRWAELRKAEERIKALEAQLVELTAPALPPVAE